jgi:hypothetical protein
MMMSQRHPGAKTGMPRWVKVFLLIGVALIVLIAVMLLTGHGPGRHMPHALELPVASR